MMAPSSCVFFKKNAIALDIAYRSGDERREHFAYYLPGFGASRADVADGHL
jgi:hypothetical protein